MNYSEAIMWFLSWPILIFVAYRIVLVAIKKMNYLND